MPNQVRLAHVINHFGHDAFFRVSEKDMGNFINDINYSLINSGYYTFKASEFVFLTFIYEFSMLRDVYESQGYRANLDITDDCFKIDIYG